jgi:hypothetical protein
MKKSFLLVSMLVTALLLVACSTPAETPEVTEVPAVAEESRIQFEIFPLSFELPDDWLVAEAPYESNGGEEEEMKIQIPSLDAYDSFLMMGVSERGTAKDQEEQGWDSETLDNGIVLANTDCGGCKFSFGIGKADVFYWITFGVVSTEPAPENATDAVPPAEISVTEEDVRNFLRSVQ